MSQWGNDSQTNSAGAVAFYDPTKFQKNAAAEFTSQNNNPDGAAPNQNAGEQPQGDQHQQNSWDTWGGWDSAQYGVNPEGGNVQNQAQGPMAYAQPGQDQWGNQVQGHWDPSTGQQWGQPFYSQPAGEAGHYEGYDPNQQYWTAGQVPTSFQGVDANGLAADPNGYYYGQDSQVAQVPTSGSYGFDLNHQQHLSQQPSDATEHIRENGDYTEQQLGVIHGRQTSVGAEAISGEGNIETNMDNNDLQNKPVIEGEQTVSNTDNVSEVPVVGTNIDGAVEGEDTEVNEIGEQLQDVSLTDPEAESIPNNAAVEEHDAYQQHQQQQQQQQQCQDQPPPFIQAPAADSASVPQSEHRAEGSTTEGSTEAPSKSDENPGFGDWEMVNKVPATGHSRNVSLDNNVQFFISSTNSSARVSPAGSGKHESHDVGVSSASKVLQPPELQQTSQGGAVLAHPTEHPQDPIPREAFAIAPPVLDPSRGVNPYRKSPQTLTHSSSNNEVSLLSSTHLDVTKPNYENSSVVLNQSISPIPITTDSRTFQNQQKRDNQSPDIQAVGAASTGPDVTNTPLSSKKTVPQSPIAARKESAFQPPLPVDRNKPVRALHDIPGVTAQENKGTDNKGESGIRQPLSRDGRRTPDRESSRRLGGGRRTPDWDADRRGGRRTPDWDSDRRGRRSPDRDGDFKRPGRRTPDWDSSRREDKDRERYSRDRDSDRLSSRPPPGKGSRNRQSAFHSTQPSRAKHNESPATTLWDEPDNLSVVSNILLVAASGSGDSTAQQNVSANAPPVLTPVASLISSMSEQIKGDEPDAKGRGKADAKNRNDDDDSLDTRDGYMKKGDKYGRVKDRETREDMRRNRSTDTLDRDGRGNKSSRNDSRERSSMYGSRGSLDLDDSRDRGRRGDSRDRSYRDKDDYYDRSYRDRDRDRPTSRAGLTIDGYRREYRDRDRGDYRERDRDYRRTDRYDRERDGPRPRHGERPSSRQGESDRPRSRADYERDSYYKERYGRGYDYDEYYRRGGTSQYGSTYDRQYYDYYYGSNYSQAGYYDEQGYYHQPDATPRYPYDSYRRRSRAGTPGSLSDGGEEISKIAVKSDASDTTSERKRFEYPPDLHDYSRGQGYDDYYGYYSQDQTYNGYRWDPHVSEWVLATPEVVPQRSTPEKFMIAHTRACFGPNGQLIQVLPNRPADGQPATVEIHSVQALLEDTEESEELGQFPGPLIKGDTHKNDVLVFCQKKARACTENMELNDRDSAELIWKFLELLIKQNGTVVGTDIAHLILEGHEPTTLDYCKSGVRIRSQSVDPLDPDDDVSSDGGHRLSNRTTPIDKSIINKNHKSVEEVTDRFRHLLMYGMKKDALDWSMKNNLWGHALFLASKMDSKAHATVMTRFANVAMRMNDPLQTLYQLMSGRQPAAVTSATEERWGDWRPHLAMVLSNHTQRPELDRKSITTLGDTLATRGFLHASHFCYLMSQTGFGSFNKKSSKIVLIGSSHGLPLLEFANNEAVQCTEIYEYALALGNTTMNVSNFQYFKYLYATRLADCGYSQEALHYCEVIARNINMYPVLYTVTLVKLVYELSNQLKYADPRRQDEAEDDIRDPDWLRELHTTLVQFEEGAIQSMSGAATPAFMPGTSASSESGEVGMYLQGTDQNGTAAQYNADGSYFPNSGMMYNTMDQTGYQSQDITDGQYHQYQYQQQEHQQVQQVSQPSQEAAMTDSGHMTTGAENQYQQHTEDNSYQTGYQQAGTEGQYSNLQWPSQQQNEAANQMTGQESANQNQLHTEVANQNHQEYYQQYGTNHNAGNWSHDQHQPAQSHNAQQSGFPADVNLSESQTSTATRESNKRSSLASVTSVSEEEEEEEDEHDGPSTSGGYPQPSIFDIQTPQQKIIAPRLRKRTTSECSTESAKQEMSRRQTIPEEKKNAPTLEKPKAGGGGGIWNKIGGLFGGNKKNEMKLPDDKEPTIIWDAEKKRWIDKEAGEQTETVAQPPPKDAAISSPATGLTPSARFNTTPPSGNKFSRRKTFGARGQYVDVMNPKPSGGATVPTNLFHTLPNSHSAPAIFNPGGTSDTSGADPRQEPIPEEKHNSGANHSDVPSSQSVPQQLSVPDSNLSRNSSASSLSREVEKIMKKSTSTGPLNSAPSMPAMFNPAQFQAGQAFKQPAPVPGHRLSSRRIYPK